MAAIISPRSNRSGPKGKRKAVGIGRKSCLQSAVEAATVTGGGSKCAGAKARVLIGALRGTTKVMP